MAVLVSRPREGRGSERRGDRRGWLRGGGKGGEDLREGVMWFACGWWWLLCCGGESGWGPRERDRGVTREARSRECEVEGEDGGAGTEETEREEVARW